MVTTVVGQLGEGVRPFEAMMRAFPPGEQTLLLFAALSQQADFPRIDRLYDRRP